MNVLNKTQEIRRAAAVKRAPAEAVDVAGRRLVIALAAFTVACLGVFAWAFASTQITVADQDGQINALHQQVGDVAASQQDAARKSQVLAEQVKGLGKTPVVAPAVPTAPPPAPVAGPKGDSGRGISGTAMRAGHLILTFTDGTAADVGQVAGPAGTPGAAGAAGVSIVSATLLSGHLVLAYSDGRSVDVGAVVGQTGAPGAVGRPGAPGRGVASARNDQGNLRITYTDGSSENLGPIPAGEAGRPPSQFTFTEHTLTGDVQHTCTPDTPPTPGSSPHYSCS